MALNNSDYKNAMLEFMDPTYPLFVNFPSSEEDAKTKWAAAFQKFIKDVVVISPTSVSPTNLAILTGCESAFKAQLNFPKETGTPEIAAEALSTAWQSGMDAIVLNPAGAQYAPANPMISISPLPSAGQKSSLKAQLITIFSNINNSASSQIQSIIDAIMTATSAALITTCIYQPPGPNPPLTGPLVFG